MRTIGGREATPERNGSRQEVSGPVIAERLGELERRIDELKQTGEEISSEDFAYNTW
ncbi:MAG: hypothetical protein ABEI52_08595 [Halobacteriaceae archaeon]